MRAHDGHVIRDQRRKGVKEERGTRPCYQVRNERSGGVQENSNVLWSKEDKAAPDRGSGHNGTKSKGQGKETTLLLV